MTRPLIVALLSTWLLAPALAQQLLPGVKAASGGQATKPAPAPLALDPVETLKAKLAAARAERDRFIAEGLATAPPGISEQDLIERRALLDLLVGTYQRQLDARDDLAVAQHEHAALAEKLKSEPGLAGGPHSAALLESEREAAQTLRQKVEAAGATVRLVATQLDVWRRLYKDAEVQLRQAEEKVTASAATADEAARRWQRDLAELRVRTYGGLLASLDALGQRAREEAATRLVELELAGRAVAAASSSVSFTREELDRLLARNDRERAAIERELAEIQSRIDARRSALKDAHAELATARGQARAQDTAERIAQLERNVDLRRIEAQNASLQYDLMRSQADAMTTDRSIWQYRYQLVNDRDEAKLRQAYDRVALLMNVIHPWKEFAERELALALALVRQQEAHLAAATSAADITHYRALGEAYRERAGLYDRTLHAIARQEAALDRWKLDFEDARRARPLSAYAGDMWLAANNIGHTIWDFELFAAEDTIEVDGRKITATRSVTVGKSIGAIVLLVLGYLVVSWFVRRMERQLVEYFKADPNVARIARRWVQFILIAVLFVLSLDLVKIPLTVFAFLGGALAIAFGFGAQNLLKNLMSGIMILIERPLKVGDLVQIGEIVGTVTNISIRSSTIRTGDGIETLVPNSALVENNVTNWTYSNSQVRRSVKVGVAYGSDTRKVSDTLLQQADRHGQILKSPAPRVIFDDFGADALVFTLEYWIDYAKGADGRQIASDLRFMTEKALAEAGIAVPFPQRDLHLDAPAPLKVELVSRAEPAVVRREREAR